MVMRVERDISLMGLHHLNLRMVLQKILVVTERGEWDWRIATGLIPPLWKMLKPHQCISTNMLTLLQVTQLVKDKDHRLTRAREGQLNLTVMVKKYRPLMCLEIQVTKTLKMIQQHFHPEELLLHGEQLAHSTRQEKSLNLRLQVVVVCEIQVQEVVYIKEGRLPMNQWSPWGGKVVMTHSKAMQKAPVVIHQGLAFLGIR
jgi:hypothetical protein